MDLLFSHPNLDLFFSYNHCRSVSSLLFLRAPTIRRHLPRRTSGLSSALHPRFSWKSPASPALACAVTQSPRLMDACLLWSWSSAPSRSLPSLCGSGGVLPWPSGGAFTKRVRRHPGDAGREYVRASICSHRPIDGAYAHMAVDCLISLFDVFRFGFGLAMFRDEPANLVFVCCRR